MQPALYPVLGILIGCIALTYLEIEITRRVASCIVMPCFFKENKLMFYHPKTDALLQVKLVKLLPLNVL